MLQRVLGVKENKTWKQTNVGRRLAAGERKQNRKRKKTQGKQRGEQLTGTHRKKEKKAETEKREQTRENRETFGSVRGWVFDS